MSETRPSSGKNKRETYHLCVICKKKCTDQETARLCIRKHLLNQNENGESMYCCYTCKQPLAEFEQALDCFVSHLPEKPTHKLVYQCLVCKTQYANEPPLQSCYRSHYCLKSEDDQKFQCPLCKDKFNTIGAAHKCFLGHPPSTGDKPHLGKEELPPKPEEKTVAMGPPKKLTAAHCLICKKNRRSTASANACCAREKGKQSLEKTSISDDSADLGVIEKPSLPETQSPSPHKKPSPQPTTISLIESDRKYFANQCCVCGEMTASPIAAKQCCSGRHKEDKRKLYKNVHFANDIILHNTADSDYYYDDDLQDKFIDITDELTDCNDGLGDAVNDNGQQVNRFKRKKSADDDGDIVTSSEFNKLKWKIAELAKQKQENHHGYSCGRCDRVFNDKTDWRQHDIMCIVSSGLMESSATVRQSLIDAIVGRWPKETALAIMAKVARDGNNGPLHINDTPTLQRICAITASAANVPARIEELPQCKFLFRY